MNKFFSLAVLLIGGSYAGAQNIAPFQISVIPEVSFVPRIALKSADTTIHGLTLNLPCGQNRVEGVTLGFVNIMSGQSHGFAAGGINVADSYRGFHLGLLNFSSTFNGCQLGLFNFSIESHTGAQVGLFNQAKELSGFQLGGFNYADKLDGVQVGLVNIIAASPWFTGWPRSFEQVFPLVNWAF